MARMIIDIHVPEMEFDADEWEAGTFASMPCADHTGCVVVSEEVTKVTGEPGAPTYVTYKVSMAGTEGEAVDTNGIVGPWAIRLEG